LVTPKLQNMTTSDLIAIISVIIAVVTSFIAIWQSSISQRFQEKLADAQKVFSKEDIKVKFFKSTLKNIIFVGKFPINGVAIIPLEIFIVNLGNRNAKDSEFYITYPNEIHLYDSSIVKSSTHGSLKEITFKLVDKLEHKHMLGFNYGNLQSGLGISHSDFLIVSDTKSTSSSLVKGEVITESKDGVKVKVNFEYLLSWIIDYYLRNEDGSLSGKCNIQIWDLTNRPLQDYLRYCKENKDEARFNQYLMGRNLLTRLCLRRVLRRKWAKRVEKASLIIDLEFQESNNNQKLRNLSPKEKKFKLYDATIAQQRVLLIPNVGSAFITSKQEYEIGII